MEIFTACSTFEALFDKTPEEFVTIITKGGSLVRMDRQWVLWYVDLVLGGLDCRYIFIPWKGVTKKVNRLRSSKTTCYRIGWRCVAFQSTHFNKTGHSLNLAQTTKNHLSDRTCRVLSISTYAYQFSINCCFIKMHGGIMRWNGEANVECVRIESDTYWEQAIWWDNTWEDDFNHIVMANVLRWSD